MPSKRIPNDKRINHSEPMRNAQTETKKGDFIVAPGIFEMITAKVADQMGFHALYMTGYGVSASHLGLPDAGLAGYTDLQGRARAIAHGISSPL